MGATADNTTGYRSLSYAERLAQQIMPEPMSGCWLWFGTCHRKGYGVMGFHGKKWKAHRVSWVLHNGEIPANMQVLHKCDTPSCVNPQHLRLGTNVENVRDKMAKGRQNKCVGSSVGTSKLTESQVRAIRADPRTYREIAKAFNIHRGTVAKIRCGYCWAHLT